MLLNVVVSVMLLVTLARGQCSCFGFAPCSTTCTQSDYTSSFTAINIPAINQSTSNDVNVAYIAGYVFQGTVVLNIDMCAPPSSVISGQRRLVINVSGNVFLGPIDVRLSNSCPSSSPTVVRQAIYYIFIANNRMNVTFTAPVITVSGLIPFGHWLSITQNIINASVQVMLTSTAPIVTTFAGMNMSAVNIAAPSSSLATSGGGADWSFSRFLVEGNVLNMTYNLQNTTIVVWRSSTAFVIIGLIAPSVESIAPRARFQVLSNVFAIRLNTTSVPSSLLFWNNASSTTPPGVIGDAVVGILWLHTTNNNVSLGTSSLVEYNANQLNLNNRLGSVYGVWQGTSQGPFLVASAAPFVSLGSDSKINVFSNVISTPKPDLARFVFVVVFTDSVDVASAGESGAFRIEFNQLYNVDTSLLTSGTGIMLGCPQLTVGFNSLLSIRNNRMWGFPVSEGNLSIPSTVVGGYFSGISFVPYLLYNGSVAPFANGGVAPIRMVGSMSLLVLDSNIVYIEARVLQPGIIFRGVVISGASSACRITSNFIGTTATSEDPTLAYRNVTVWYGQVTLQGTSSVFVYARQVVKEVDFPGGVIGMFAFGSSPKTVTLCSTCRLWLGCTVRGGNFNKDSNSNPGTQIEFVSTPSTYDIALRTNFTTVDCTTSCDIAAVACFVPGTRESIGYLRNDYLPECTCRCGLGYSFSRQCGPPQGLNSGTISVSNLTYALTTTETASISQQGTFTTSESMTTSASETLTLTETVTDSRSVSATKTRSITETESMSPCYNITAWETVVTNPMQEVEPNYFYGNISYVYMNQNVLDINVSLLPPARVGVHWTDWNRPNWNSPIFNMTYEPTSAATPDDAMSILAIDRSIGLMAMQLRIYPIYSSQYEEVRFRWLFNVTNAVCPLRPYVFDVELKIDPVPIYLANETRDATAAAMFIAALHGNSPVGALLARAPLMTGAVACFGPMAPYENSVSMTFFRFGSVRGQYARGGVTGNLIAVGAVIAFYLLVLGFLSLITHVSSMSLAVANAVEALHVKSNYVGVALCVLQPTIGAGIALLRNPVDDNDEVIGGIAIAVAVIYVIGICCKLLLFPPDVVLVYDLIRPHQVPPSKVVKFLRWFFWPKYHFLPRNDYRRKIERMLWKDPSIPTEPLETPINEAKTHEVEALEETEEDNEKLQGLLKMTAEEYKESRRWERLELGDVLIIPPPPKKLGVVLVEREEPAENVPAAEPSPTLADLAEDVEKPEFTDVARQVESAFSFEDMFNNHDAGADTYGIGLITENERLSTLQQPKSRPMNLVELQRIEREEEIRKAKEAAKAAREAKIQEIKDKIASETAAREAAALQAQQKEEERIMVPLQVLELMRMAKSDKHDWHVLIRGWSHPRYALGPHVFAVVLGVAQGFGDDFCRQQASLLLASFVVELTVLVATQLRAVVLPFHRAWYIIALSLGIANGISMITGQEALLNKSLDVSGVFALLYALSCLVRTVVDGISTVFHMRVNSEKSMSLIARGQDILEDEEMELHYVPPPLPQKPEEPPPPPVVEPTRQPTPPPPPVIEEEPEEEWEDDPDRIFNPLGNADPVAEEEEEYDF